MKSKKYDHVSVRNIFIAVNYNTSSFISGWARSILDLDDKAIIILVDNFSNILERNMVIKICNSLDITYLLSENVGYGSALNFAIDYIHKTHSFKHDWNVIVHAGNLDIEFKHVPDNLPKGNYAYMLRAKEGGRNRNPFLTNLQKKFLSMHRLSLNLNSTAWFKFVIIFLRVISYIPSSPWTTHGSLFSVSYSALKQKGPIFDENSFLYSEELEYGSWLSHEPLTKLIECDGEYEHSPHAATKNVNSNFKDFFKLWKPSYRNWLNKQKDTYEKK